MERIAHRAHGMRHGRPQHNVSPIRFLCITFFALVLFIKCYDCKNTASSFNNKRFRSFFILFFATARRKEPKEAPPTALFPLKIAHVFLILFFATARRKESKEAPPSAHLPLKITHVFGRGARRPLRALIGAPLFSENAPDFLNAPDVRPDSQCCINLFTLLQ